MFTVLFVPGVSPGRWERAWRERMPRHPLELRPAGEDEALAAVVEGGARMAFLRGIERGTHRGVELHVIPLYREEIVVVAPRDHPVAAFDALTRSELTGETLLPGHDPEAVELVAAGAGLAILPRSVARIASRRDVVARPLTDEPESAIGLAWRADSDDPLIDAFIGIVRGRTENSSR